jgi:hypothetical protein
MTDAPPKVPRHPLYLDVPMMTSFLAYLEGGVAAKIEQVTTATADATKQKEGGAGLKTPSIMGLLGVDISGKLAATSSTNSSEELRVARQHTSASLFNVLHDQLRSGALLHSLSTSDQLDGLAAGDIVELSGRYEGNPLEDLLAMMNQLLPYIDVDESNRTPEGNGSAKRSGNPARKAAAGKAPDPATAAAEAAKSASNAGIQLFRQMHRDVQESPVSDVVLRTESGLRVVATVAREFFTTEVSAMLKASNATVVGKVTSVERTDPINLTRRTVLGAMDSDQARQMLLSIGESEDFNFAVTDPIVEAPTLQLMPLAIYI